jgi:uncharacterized phiE125 gp8 family phage protein
MMAWLRLDDIADASQIAALITAARLLVEAHTGRLLITQSWRMSLDRWPLPCGNGTCCVPVPLMPFQNVIAINVKDANGLFQPVDLSFIESVAEPDSAQIIIKQRLSAPECHSGGIQIDLHVGYGDQPVMVPETLRHAIRLLVAHWYENRGDTEGTGSGNAMPAAVAALIAPWRQTRLL